MSFITFMCSRTGDFVSTGVRTDEQSFKAIPPRLFRTRCRACSSEHVWSKGRAWLTEKDDRRVLPAIYEAVWLEPETVAQGEPDPLADALSELAL